MNITTSNEYRMTPIGVAKFCYVSEKDTQFDTNGIYHVSLELTKEEAQPEINAIKEVISKKVAEIYKAKPGTKEIKRASLPYKEEAGKIVIKFKSKFKPKAWDKEGKELPSSTLVYKGSTMRVKYKLNAYDQSIGVGCSLYLLSFQVVNLVEGVSEAECPFNPVKENNVSRLPGPEVKAVY